MSNDVLANAGLSDSQVKFYSALEGKGDVDIKLLYREVVGDPADVDPRIQQQRLGAHATKMNRRLARFKVKVKPGKKRRTYALTPISA